MKQNYHIDMLYEARLVNLSLPRSALGTLLAQEFPSSDWSKPHFLPATSPPDVTRLENVRQLKQKLMISICSINILPRLEKIM